MSVIKNKTFKQLLWVGMGAIAMFFAGLTSAYIVRKAEGNWTEVILPEWFWYSTITIILSSVILFLAKQKIKKNKPIFSFVFLVFVLGVIFSYFQLRGWEALTKPAGRYPFPFTVDTEIYLKKTNSNGDVLWIKTFGGLQETGANTDFYVEQTTDGGYILFGYTKDSLTIDNAVYLMKIDRNGDSLWTKKYQGPFPPTLYTNAMEIIANMDISVQQTYDGGYILCGVDTDVYLIKTDSNGDLLDKWTRKFRDLVEEGHENSSSSYSIGKDSNGDYIRCNGILRDTLRRDNKVLDRLQFRSRSDKKTTDGGYINCGITEPIPAVYLTGESSNVAGSFFYVITLSHLVHLIGGLIALLVTAINAKRKKYSAENYLGLEITSIYWHFLSILWIYLFCFLKYL